MPDELQVGLVGLTCGAKPVYDALLGDPRVRITAVGDRDADAIARATEDLDARGYTDYRSLVAEGKLDALFVAVPHFAAQGCLKLAAAQGTPVWKQTPLARRLDEAIALTRLFERSVPGGCPLVVARSWPAEPAMEQAAKILAEAGKPFLVEARAFACRPDDLDWRGDSERAGGGVLLNELYTAIDLVVHWLGPPAEVYAAMSRASRPQPRFPYDTEDTAIVAMKFTDGAVASFTCCWTAGPPTVELTIRATGKTIRIEPAKVAILGRGGESTGTPLDRAPNPYAHPIRAFLDGLTGDRKRMTSLARDHLWTMAVIETAYLSSRTGEAESPERWFDILRAEEVPVPRAETTAEKTPSVPPMPEPIE